jgi:hypothetical protein
MKLGSLIAIAAIASVLNQSSVFAQETPAPETPGSIAPDITAGITATYNFSRSGTTSLTSGGVTTSTNISGGTFNVGINASYNF